MLPAHKAAVDLQRAQQHRRVPRNDRADDAERLAAGVAQDVLAQRDRFAFQFAGQTAEVTENIGDQRGFRPRLGADGVAGFLGDDAGEFLDARFQRLGDARQQAAALAGHGPAPAREGGVSGLHRTVHIFGRAARDGGDGRAPPGVFHGQHFAGGGVNPFAVDQHPHMAERAGGGTGLFGR